MKYCLFVINLYGKMFFTIKLPEIEFTFLLRTKSQFSKCVQKQENLK